LKNHTANFLDGVKGVDAAKSVKNTGEVGKPTMSISTGLEKRDLNKKKKQRSRVKDIDEGEGGGHLSSGGGKVKGPCGGKAPVESETPGNKGKKGVRGENVADRWV